MNTLGLILLVLTNKSPDMYQTWQFVETEILPTDPSWEIEPPTAHHRVGIRNLAFSLEIQPLIHKYHPHSYIHQLRQTTSLHTLLKPHDDARINT